MMLNAVKDYVGSLLLGLDGSGTVSGLHTLKSLKLDSHCQLLIDEDQVVRTVELDSALGVGPSSHGLL